MIITGETKMSKNLIYSNENIKGKAKTIPTAKKIMYKFNDGNQQR